MIVDPSAAVASATTAAAVNAAVNPVGPRRRRPAPPAARPIAVNVAVPRAAPIWVAEPASPEARPTCVSGTADGDDHGGGHEAEGDAGGDEQQPGQDGDEVAGLARRVGQPQVAGGEDDQADDESAPRAEDAYGSRQHGERDGEPREGGGDHGQPCLLGGHGEGLLEVESDEHERGRPGGAAEEGEADAGAQDPGPEEVEGHERVRGAAFDDHEGADEQRQPRRGWP